MHYKVSVVVPVHNVAPYIERCAASLFGQTLEEMQLIFVDDHSEDASMDLLERLLERYPKRRPHTRMVHLEEDHGTPAARRRGQSFAEGEYIAHCDSDDYVDTTMYETLYNAAIGADADIAECDFWHDNGHFCRRRRHCEPGADNVGDFLKERAWPYLWCRIVRSEICRRLDFSPWNYLEDWYMLIQMFYYAKRRIVVHEALYHYCFNPGSVTHEVAPEDYQGKIEECMGNYGLVHDFVVGHCAVDEEDFVMKKISIKEKCLPPLAKTGDARWRKAYLHVFQKVNGRLLFSPRVPMGKKAVFLAVVTGVYPLVERLRECYRKMWSRVMLDGAEMLVGEMCSRTK